MSFLRFPFAYIFFASLLSERCLLRAMGAEKTEDIITVPCQVTYQLPCVLLASQLLRYLNAPSCSSPGTAQTTELVTWMFSGALLAQDGS